MYAAAWTAVEVRFDIFQYADGTRLLLAVTFLGWAIGLVAYAWTRSRLAAQMWGTMLGLAVTLVLVSLANSTSCESLVCAIASISLGYGLVGLGLVAPGALLILAAQFAQRRNR